MDEETISPRPKEKHDAVGKDIHRQMDLCICVSFFHIGMSVSDQYKWPTNVLVYNSLMFFFSSSSSSTGQIERSALFVIDTPTHKHFIIAGSLIQVNRYFLFFRKQLVCVCVVLRVDCWCYSHPQTVYCIWVRAFETWQASLRYFRWRYGWYFSINRHEEGL